MNSPSSGAVTLGLALNILENLNYTQDGFGSVLHVKAILNALALAFADRNAYLGDADWVNIPIAGLLDKQYAKLRSTLINATRAIIDVAPGRPAGAPPPDLTVPEEGNHTSSFSIIDQFGNVLVCTTTIQDEWGNKNVVPGRGFILNNELTDFSSSGNNAIMGGQSLRRTALPPDNSTLGGKRPRSSMTPSIIFKDGEPIIGLGSPGGTAIIGAVYQVILNFLDYRMDPKKAVDSPRGFSSNTPSWRLEEGLMTTDMINKLTEYGVGIVNNTAIGVVAVVTVSNGNYNASHDFRRGNGLELVVNE